MASFQITRDALQKTSFLVFRKVKRKVTVQNQPNIRRALGWFWLRDVKIRTGVNWGQS